MSGDERFLRCNEVGKRLFGRPLAMTSCCKSIGSRANSPRTGASRLCKNDVIADRICRPEAVDAARGQKILLDYPLGQRRVHIELTRGGILSLK